MAPDEKTLIQAQLQESVESPYALSSMCY
jgi:hypothetical protein